VSSAEQAEMKNKLAALEEDTEQRMHLVAEALTNPEDVHGRANRLTDRARIHRRQRQSPRTVETPLR
jgi:hypothetical protein